MVSSSWCGDTTNAPPGSRRSVAVRPAAVCAHPHTAPIGGRENPARRRVTAVATNPTAIPPCTGCRTPPSKDSRVPRTH